MKNGKFEVTTLCGSTKFKDEFDKQAKALSFIGHVILRPESYNHAEGTHLSDKMFQQFVEMHMQKIDMSDSIFVINVDGYIGESTYNEIMHAADIGIEIGFLCKPSQGLLNEIEAKRPKEKK